jgi:hypothetical protein
MVPHFAATRFDLPPLVLTMFVIVGTGGIL